MGPATSDAGTGDIGCYDGATSGDECGAATVMPAMGVTVPRAAVGAATVAGDARMVARAGCTRATSLF